MRIYNTTDTALAAVRNNEVFAFLTDQPTLKVCAPPRAAQSDAIAIEKHPHAAVPTAAAVIALLSAAQYTVQLRPAGC